MTVRPARMVSNLYGEPGESEFQRLHKTRNVFGGVREELGRFGAFRSTKRQVAVIRHDEEVARPMADRKRS